MCNESVLHFCNQIILLQTLYTIYTQKETTMSIVNKLDNTMKNIFKILVLISLFTSTSVFAMKDNTTLTKQYQKLKMQDGYKAILSSKKPLKSGENTLNIVILKNNTFVKNADVNIIFALPTTENIEFSEHAIENGEQYNLNANFKIAGEWEYELMFKTSYGVIYSKEGRVTIN